MTKLNYGLSGLNRRISNKQSNDFVTNLAQNSNNIIIIARVLDILLDDKDPVKFSSFNGWTGLGTIRYESIDKRIQTVSGYAKPMDSNIKKYPLINEFVAIILAPNPDLGENPYVINAYYINNINLWNHPHHNAYPSNPDKQSSSQNKSYTQIEAGSTILNQNDPITINLGKTFKEKSDIHPLLPFEGDIIYEGRWGNSIRLGSTVKGLNNWSSFGDNGDPITIIRNGQGRQTSEGWTPILENINNDNSSIYLTNNQKIPLAASSTNYTSYNYKNDTPATPNNYAQAQIILSSGRLVFNTYEDHILLSSAKSINLNSLTSVNIDTPNFIVQANKIYLGKNEASEPLLLGNQTVNLLKDLIKVLHSFMSIASTATTNICVPGSPVTLPTINNAASDVLDVLEDLKSKLDNNNIVSNRNFTV